MTDDLLCSWDSVHDPVHAAYTTTNAAEISPGLTRPLPADLWRACDYLWDCGLVEDLGTQDLVAIPEPPTATTMPFIAGRLVINYGINVAFAGTFAAEEGSDTFKQLVGGGEAVRTGASENQSRNVATRQRMVDRWQRAEEVGNEHRETSTRAYLESRLRDWKAPSDGELVDALDEAISLLGRIFLGHYYATLGGAEFTTAIENLLKEHLPDHPPGWTNTVTSGLTGVESAEPAKAIWDLSRFILARPPLAGEFASLSADDFAAGLEDPPGPDWQAFAAEYAGFIDRCGFRGQNEIDPSHRTWDEAPHFVLSIIQANLNAGPDRDPHERERKQAAAREAVEREIESRLPAEALDEYRQALELGQMLNRAREMTKANWVRATRSQRPPVVELGRRLAERGLLDDAEDVWFLRLSELPQAAEGTLDAGEAKANVAARKAEMASLEGYELPVMFDWPVELIPKEAASAVSSATYDGLGISPGAVTGRARVVTSAAAAMSAELEPGEILVAPVTDAGWTPLFIPAAGVVVETGGILSHAATVAREFGIPAVAEVRKATELIPDGATVTIDGSTGTVTVEP